MAQTLTSLIVHLVFSTKNRVPIITPEVEPDLFNYMGGILKNYSSLLLAAGGTQRPRAFASLAVKKHSTE